jgi:hypothetical protein
MTQEDAIKIVKDTIQNAWRHKNYSRTVKLAKQYKSYITGEGMDDELHRLQSRETEEEFNARKEITVNVTETVCSNIIDPQYKLPRSNSIENRLEYIEATTSNYDEMVALRDSFWEGDKSVDDWMGQAWIELNNLDPNTFVAIDWKTNNKGERIRPYPVEYPAHQVYHYNKKAGDIEWIILHRDEELPDPEMYLFYSKNFSIVFSRKESYEWKNHQADVEFYKEFPLGKFDGVVGVLKNEDDYYDIKVFTPHNLNRVPGFFVGFVSDLFTRTSYLSFIHKAFPVLKKIVKVNSELDITISKHAFQQKVQYATPCQECFGKGTTRDGAVCGECGGGGVDKKEVHSSGLDVQLIPRPRDINDLFDLSKLIHYVPTDVRIPKFQHELVEYYTRKCKEAVYNSHVFSTKEFTETAYSKNVDLQNVYDALWPMAKAYARTYNFIVGTIAKIADLDKNLSHSLTFRKDFKMKGLSELYADLELALRSGADEFVIKDIEYDIAQIMYENDPDALAKYKTVNHFFPFNGKKRDEIQYIVATNNLVPQEKKVLWANFSYIFDKIELEYKRKNVNFYRLPIDKQTEIVDNAVDNLMNAVQSTMPTIPITNGRPVQDNQA